jgi:hypothetical protein
LTCAWRAQYAACRLWVSPWWAAEREERERANAVEATMEELNLIVLEGEGGRRERVLTKRQTPTSQHKAGRMQTQPSHRPSQVLSAVRITLSKAKTISETLWYIYGQCRCGGRDGRHPGQRAARQLQRHHPLTHHENNIIPRSPHPYPASRTRRHQPRIHQLLIRVRGIRVRLAPKASPPAERGRRRVGSRVCCRRRRFCKETLDPVAGNHLHQLGRLDMTYLYECRLERKNVRVVQGYGSRSLAWVPGTQRAKLTKSSGQSLPVHNPIMSCSPPILVNVERELCNPP